MALLAFVLVSLQLASPGGVAVMPTVRVDGSPCQGDGLALEALARELETSRAPARERLYDALSTLGSAAATQRLARALEVRWTRALALVSNQGFRRQVEPIVDLRKRLDAWRAETLIRIRGARAANDGSARDESNALIRPAVERIRRLWNSAAVVDVPRSFRESLEELEWNRRRQLENGLAFEGLSSVPEWLLSIDSKERWLTIKTFAWDRTERALWESNQRVEEKNFAWSFVCCPGPDMRSPSLAEEELVRLVNEHRNMFGLPSLWWSVTLQESVRESAAPETSDASRSASSPTVRITMEPALVSVYTGRACALWIDHSAAPETVVRSWCDCTQSHAVLLANEWCEMACSERSDGWVLLAGSADSVAR